MGDIKKNIANLNDPRMPYNYAEREYGTVPKDTKRAPFQWVSEIAYKNVHRIVTRGYETTELMEEGYGLVEVLFINFQSRIPSANEEKNAKLYYWLSIGGWPFNAGIYLTSSRQIKNISNSGRRSFNSSFWPCLWRIFCVWKSFGRIF